MVQTKVAFLFDERPQFPPDFDNIKCYYVSEEMERRGVEVTWVSMTGGGRPRNGGIAFAGLGAPKLPIISPIYNFLAIISFCIANSIRIAYVDAWLYSRDSPLRQLITIIIMRISGIRVIVDQRDPYLDFELARGAVRSGTLRHRLLKVHEKATLYACNQLILPSKAYEKLLKSEGAPPGKVKGYFRGIDLTQFKPSVIGNRVRAGLGLEGSFVVGWFGIMYGYRQINEVLIPLAQTIGSLVPNGRMILGGRGPLEGAVRRAKTQINGGQFYYVGPIRYSDLPEYLSACDVLLCPVNTGFRFTRHSNWLKILEGLAMGVPVIATRTKASEVDLAGLEGVVWTGEGLADFQRSIKSTYENFGQIKQQATNQARNLCVFGIVDTIPKIVDQIFSPSA